MLSAPPSVRRGMWARVTIDQFRHLVLRTFYGQHVRPPTLALAPPPSQPPVVTENARWAEPAKAFTAYLCLVCNSIGPDAYVPYEIIRSRAGTHVLVCRLASLECQVSELVNSDACPRPTTGGQHRCRGPFAMADALCEAKDEALALAPAARGETVT